MILHASFGYHRKYSQTCRIPIPYKLPEGQMCQAINNREPYRVSRKRHMKMTPQVVLRSTLAAMVVQKRAWQGAW